MNEKYTVLSVDKRERYGPAGKRATIFIVHIRTARGSTGSIEIAEADFETEKVKAALDELYEKLEMPFGL